jgi:hypothetical protein
VAAHLDFGYMVVVGVLWSVGLVMLVMFFGEGLGVLDGESLVLQVVVLLGQLVGCRS